MCDVTSNHRFYTVEAGVEDLLTEISTAPQPWSLIIQHSGMENAEEGVSVVA